MQVMLVCVCHLPSPICIFAALFNPAMSVWKLSFTFFLAAACLALITFIFFTIFFLSVAETAFLGLAAGFCFTAMGFFAATVTFFKVFAAGFCFRTTGFFTTVFLTALMFLAFLVGLSTLMPGGVFPALTATVQRLYCLVHSAVIVFWL